MAKICDICKKEFEEWRIYAEQHKVPHLVIPVQFGKQSHRMSFTYGNELEDICKPCTVEALEKWVDTNK